MAADFHGPWCLLIHSIPARPLYVRARIRRLLAQSGAAPLKNSVYAAPRSDETEARLQEIAAEIRARGGTAFLCDAHFPDRDAAREVVRAYNEVRHADYRAFTDEARRIRVPVRPVRVAAARGRPRKPGLEQLRERLALLESFDRFGAAGADEARAILARLETQGSKAARGSDSLKGLRWVTRKGLHVDRLACAWVVRRFIDPGAEFRFTATPEAPVGKGEIGFDMPGAAISHEDGGCSVESLIARAAIRDGAVRRIAEIVHDMDLRDERYAHAERAGFEQVLVGTLVSTPSDAERLERGLALFDALYASLKARRPGAPILPHGPAPRVQFRPSKKR